MPKFVSDDALEFDHHFVYEMLGTRKDNQKHLALVRRALADIIAHELTGRQKEMVYLYYYEGKNSREISELLCVNKSTVCRTLSRARERIRKHLRFYFDYRNISAGEE